MKIQNMAIIFSIIIIPVTLILSAYIGTQIDTSVIQQQYSTHLMDATHDAIVAFQSNTINNKYSGNADSLRRDISAAINAFSTSLSSSTLTSADTIMNYVPALVFTLYDGYYIYSPVEYIKDDGSTAFKHILKPYIHYSVRYKDENNDIVINYSLDNYISVYGYVKGEYVANSGYLIDLDKVKLEGNTVIGYEEDKGFIVDTTKTENLYEFNETGSSVSKETESAKKYYQEAYEFTKWLIKDKKIDNIVIPQNAVKSDGSKYTEFSNDNTIILATDVKDKTSAFNNHKREIMKISIQENLNNAIASYNEHTTKGNFAMPKLTETDWDKILTNVNMISFMQGIQVGTKLFNDYSIVTSTKNKQYIDPASLYFTDDSDTYHKINCSKLHDENIIGYKSVDFSRFMKSTKNDEGVKEYYRKHKETACYECIVNSLSEDFDISKLSTKKKQAYYTALAREKYDLYKNKIK